MSTSELVVNMMLIKIVIFLTFGSYICCQLQSDAGLNARQLIEKYGFPFENYTVITTDGYILEIHRIPHGRNNSQVGPPVLVVPGSLSSSADFVNAGEKSLGFILADNGYDVWLANYRGIFVSRKHVRLNPDVDRKEYWDFSFQEIGHYDIPTFIDYVLNVTKQKKLYYIGHSQGCISLFALLSDKPEYNNKVRLMVALGPPAYFTHGDHFIGKFLSEYKYEVQAFVDLFELYEIPHMPWLGTIGRIFCNDFSPFQDLCAVPIYIIAGYSPDQMEKSLIPTISTNDPAGGSLRTWQHMGQLYGSEKFSKYDFGEKENMVRYGQQKPPVYNLTRITVPVAIYLGDKDILISKEDTDRAANEMQNTILNKYVKGFNHVDYIWGIDAANVIFNEILELMRRN